MNQLMPVETSFLVNLTITAMSVDSPESHDSNATRFVQIHPLVGEILRSFAATAFVVFPIRATLIRRSSVPVKDRSISPTNGLIWKTRVALESRDSGESTDTSVIVKLTEELVFTGTSWFIRLT